MLDHRLFVALGIGLLAGVAGGLVMCGLFGAGPAG